MEKMDRSWDDFYVGRRCGKHLFLWGPPGTGKTRAALDDLGKGGRQVWSVTLNEDWAVQELQSQWQPKYPDWIMNLGPVVKAFSNGDGLVVNELPRASGPVKDFFLPVLDHPDFAELVLPDATRIPYKKGFQVVATSNTPPDDLEEALVDRFTIINITIPHPGIIQTLNEGLPGLGDLILDSYKDKPERIISPRGAIDFLDFRKKRVEINQSARLAFGERYEEVMELLLQKGVL